MSPSKQLELVPISAKFIEEGGCHGRIVDRRMLDYDAVIDEVIAKNFIRMEPRNLRMPIEGVLDTTIAGVLKDGNSRRLGDYFTLQLEVRGKFDGPGEQFDPSKHKLALALRPRSPRRTRCRSSMIRSTARRTMRSSRWTSPKSTPPGRRWRFRGRSRSR